MKQSTDSKSFCSWVKFKSDTKEKVAFSFLKLTGFLCCLHRGSKWCHIVPPASRQKEEPGLLLLGVWRSQNSSSGPPPADERQGEGLGKPGHCGMGWSPRGPGPRGHGQGQSKAEGQPSCMLYPVSSFCWHCILSGHHQVKVLFVRNLASSVTEELLEKAFSQFGKLERVKKLKDYAFIHFEERDGAVKVLTGRTAVYHFWYAVAGDLKHLVTSSGSGWPQWQRPRGRAHWNCFCQTSWSEEERAQSSETSC